MIYLLIIIVGLVILFEIGRLLWCGYLTIVAGEKTIPATNYPTSPLGKILVLGDSTSYGVGASLSENSLVGRLIKDYPHYTLINKSKTALKFSVLEKQLAELIDAKELDNLNFIFLHIGGIDALHFTSEKEIKRIFDLFADFCKSKKVDQAFVVTVNNAGNVPLFRFPLNIFLKNRFKTVSSQLNFLAQKHGFVAISLYEDKTSDPLLALPGLFSKDKIHPNDAGYALWYEKIHQAISPYLKTN